MIPIAIVNGINLEYLDEEDTNRRKVVKQLFSEYFRTKTQYQLDGTALPSRTIVIVLFPMDVATRININDVR